MHISDFLVLDDGVSAKFRIQAKRGQEGELWAIIDAHRIPDILHFERCYQHDWSNHGIRVIAFCGRKAQYLHRILHGDPGPGNRWSCVSSNTLDCRAANWVAKTKEESFAYRDTYLDKEGIPKAPYRNVRYNPKSNGWCVNYNKDGVKHYVGTFGFEEACKKSQEISIQLGRKVFPLPTQEDIDFINNLYNTPAVIKTKPHSPTEVRKAIMAEPPEARVIDLSKKYGLNYATVWQLRNRPYMSKKARCIE